ncbi:hypothetical protein LQ318_09365 [Aliifodinibius salicampi]|uniref:Tetratricopeptide repeat-containing protein n=1 Tax=Fodinibius salicampi TaxID=1920655 RepID=A0ABT3PZ42_9BACT|nr:hypothetical protein [Fodinibius salicampi]MCW9713111.1 hypothetical protein [Fodinibius salicampi]
MKTLKLLLLLCLLLPLSGAAQVPELVTDSEFRPDAKAAVDSIYNFQFEGADRRLSEWKEKYPQHPLWTLMEGMKFWWEILSDLQDTSHDEQFINMMKKANYQAGKLLDEQPGHVDALIIQAISNGYIARQYSNREEWISSLNYARKALNANEKLKNQESGLADLKLAEGLKRYYAAYLPEAYPIVKTVSWMLPEGDKGEGLELLREASENAIFARAEATYFLGNIAFNYEKEYMEAVQHFVELQRQYPRNNYYARLLVKSYYRLRHYGKALEYIKTTLRHWDNEGFPKQKILQEELWTWKGQIVERMGNVEEALALYKSAFELGGELPNTRERSFWMVSGYKAGNILAKRGEHEEARHYLEKVAEASRSSSYRDKARDLLSELE